jgi:hypothetical protein
LQPVSRNQFQVSVPGCRLRRLGPEARTKALRRTAVNQQMADSEGTVFSENRPVQIRRRTANMDSWRLHVTEMPFSMPTSNTLASEIWKQDLSFELSNSETANHTLPGSTQGPNIGHNNFFSITRANGDTILLSQPLVDDVEPWSLQTLNVSSSPDSIIAIPMPNFHPTCENGKQMLSNEIPISSSKCRDIGFLMHQDSAWISCSSKSVSCVDRVDSFIIPDGILMQTIEIHELNHGGPSATANCVERPRRHHIGSDQIPFSQPAYDSTLPPSGRDDLRGASTDPKSWRPQILEIPSTPVDAANPCSVHLNDSSRHGKRKHPERPDAEGSRASVRKHEPPQNATAALFMDVAEQPESTICIHGRRRTRCTTCQGTYVCSHGRVKSQCRDCGGPSFCIHGRRKTACKDCGGSLFCSHGRQKSRCKDCGGVSICCHGRRRSQCRECGGAAICCHGRRRSACKDCRVASVSRKAQRA